MMITTLKWSEKNAQGRRITVTVAVGPEDALGDAVKAAKDFVSVALDRAVEEPDAPIANPAERVQAVCDILRNRGLPFRVAGTTVEMIYDGKVYYHTDAPVHKHMGPRAIANMIQFQEGVRVRKL